MANPKGNPQNLRPPWRPGDPSPNPGGVAKGKKLSTVLRDLMDMTTEELQKFMARKDLTAREQIALRWMQRLTDLSEKGGPALLDMALDRHEGKVVQTHKIVDPGRKGMTPEELDEMWKRRQTRKS
jgi:hypothetical protein